MAEEAGGELGVAAGEAEPADVVAQLASAAGRAHAGELARRERFGQQGGHALNRRGGGRGAVAGVAREVLGQPPLVAFTFRLQWQRGGVEPGQLVQAQRGGLAQVTTVFSMFFSGMSGSSSADVAVLSRTMAKPMAAEGYSPAFVAALIAAVRSITRA